MGAARTLGASGKHGLQSRDAEQGGLVTIADAVPGERLARTAFDLARRFASGATMWCVAPEWPEHARHVAVEFVHPVIVGKRALPAVAFEGNDPVAALRAVVRAGDVLLAVGRCDQAMIRDALRRAPAWGVHTIWLGVGEPPAGAVADHEVWTGDASGVAAHDGGLILLYHLLWELTHVCFEHPGLMRDEDAAGGDEVCVTCSDEGRLGEVVAIQKNGATVRTARGVESVDLTLVAGVGVGELVLVHAGIAIATETIGR
jgi:hypothetical protein